VDGVLDIMGQFGLHILASLAMCMWVLHYLLPPTSSRDEDASSIMSSPAGGEGLVDEL
jgi:hypothetical protein